MRFGDTVIFIICCFIALGFLGFYAFDSQQELKALRHVQEENIALKNRLNQLEQALEAERQSLNAAKSANNSLQAHNIALKNLVDQEQAKNQVLSSENEQLKQQIANLQKGNSLDRSGEMTSSEKQTDDQENDRLVKLQPIHLFKSFIDKIAQEETIYYGLVFVNGIAFIILIGLIAKGSRTTSPRIRFRNNTRRDCQ